MLYEAYRIDASLSHKIAIFALNKNCYFWTLDINCILKIFCFETWYEIQFILSGIPYRYITVKFKVFEALSRQKQLPFFGFRHHCLTCVYMYICIIYTLLTYILHLPILCVIWNSIASFLNPFESVS